MTGYSELLRLGGNYGKLDCVHRTLVSADPDYDDSHMIFGSEKLGSNLGPITAENAVMGPKKTQNQLKRDNNLAFSPLLRDQDTAHSS